MSPVSLWRSAMRLAALLAAAAILALGCGADGDPDDPEIPAVTHRIAGVTYPGSCGVSTCSAWSGYQDVGGPYCSESRRCVARMPDGFEVRGPEKLQKRENYRSCSLRDGTPCQEVWTMELEAGCCARLDDF